MAADWFDAVQGAAAAVLDGETGADEFAAELARLPFPDRPGAGEAVHGMVFWTRPSNLSEIDQEAPRAALECLLAASLEAG